MTRAIARLLAHLVGAPCAPAAPAAAAPAPHAPTMPPIKPTQPEWRALPGHMIELGNSGFRIVLNTSPSRALYTLYAPMGWVVLGGADLPALKQLGERFAAEWHEFDCAPLPASTWSAKR